MYHYNRSKNQSRQTVTPKESHIFGPHFTVQPTNGSASDRSKPNSADVRKDSLDLMGGLATNSNLLRRLTHPNESSIAMDKFGNPSLASTSIRPRLSIPQNSYQSDVPTYNLSDQILPHHEESHRIRSAKFSPKHQKGATVLPGDRVVFAESSTHPGVPIVYRSLDERNANPDRLNLDRRNLTMCPLLEGEDQLRLLNYQHNSIAQITHLSNLRRLIFLDLYDNRIEEINGMQTLRSLRVLMLGKNRIKKIQNLQSLTKLDVLDLHGNQITEIENLSHLSELRVLNLAGNEIGHVDNLAGMDALAELNLRRNRIKTINDVDNLPCIQRLFLSFNEIESYDDISCLGYSTSLSEISLDGNPLYSEPNYKQIILKQLQQLRLLDMKRVSEEERRIAVVMSRKDEEKKRELSKATMLKEKRRLAICNAKRQWEATQGQLLAKSGLRGLGAGRMPEIYANHVGTIANQHAQEEEADSLSGGSRPNSSRSGARGSGQRSDRPRSAKTEVKEPLVLSPLGPSSSTSHLAELDSETLNLYGAGSLEALDRSWGLQAAGAVTCVSFSFIQFNDITRHMYKVRARFPSLNTIKFHSANIEYLNQLNALAGLRRLEHVVVSREGNPVTEFNLWKSYLLYRLAHFNLKKINDVDVMAIDIVNAENLFRPLGDLTAANLPKSRLYSLVSENRRKLTDDKAKCGPNKLSESRSAENVTRAALSYSSNDYDLQKIQSRKTRREASRCFVKDLKREASSVNAKRRELQTIWPQIYMDLIKSAVVDMLPDRNAYMRKCVDELDAKTGDG